jgi:parallel beta-helix repeat protein
MQRRDISKVLVGSAVGSVLGAQQAVAQTCTPPCFAMTAAESAAGATVLNSEYRPGDLRRYCAGNGTNESTKVNAALACNSLVTVPAGFTVSTTGNHSLAAGQTLTGPGTLKLHSGSNPLVQVSVAGATIRSLKFDLSAGSGTSRIAISIGTGAADIAVVDNTVIHGRIVTTGSAPLRIRIDGNTLSSAKVGGTSGGAISIDGGTLDFSVTNNTVISADGSGIGVFTDSRRGVISENLCRGNAGNGIYVDRGQHLTLSSNVCEANGHSGIGWNNGSTSPRPQRSSIVGNICRGNDYDGIDINVDNSTVQYIYLEVIGNHCEANGTVGAATGINLQFAGLCTVSGNQVFGNATYGIQMYGAELCTVQGNVCTANGGLAPGTYDGIALTGARNCTLTGNVSTNISGGANQRYGIAEQGSADGNVLTSNVCINNVNVAGILKLGANSISANNRV